MPHSDKPLAGRVALVTGASRGIGRAAALPLPLAEGISFARGRTARVDGNQGTGHGTGTVALLLGGALKGGRVIADWPGVKETDLYQSVTASRARAARPPLDTGHQSKSTSPMSAQGRHQLSSE